MNVLSSVFLFFFQFPVETTKKTVAASTPKPGGDKPQPGGGDKPQPGGGGGDFGLDDLNDAVGGLPAEDPSGHDNKPIGGGGEEPPQENQSVIAGIVSAVAVAAVGAVSSFIAYQKKKLCFKGAGADDPENVNPDAHKGDQAEPQVQSTLLQK
ncbi:CD99 antigen-like isoform X2 [Pseudophryne corroboree]|uniref:CD99 antigen-like isoform X2 n=1 Tax=Pseudophryne corroboree TaxID=495146 RepID=UPI003082067F